MARHASLVEKSCSATRNLTASRRSDECSASSESVLTILGPGAQLQRNTQLIQGKLTERSHRTDQEEFYQLLTYTDDVDLVEKLAAWEDFYNLDRPHGAHAGQSPYEALRDMLNQPESVPLG